MKSRKKSQRREHAVLSVLGRRRTENNLRATGELRRKFQDGRKREQKLPVIGGIKENGEMELTTPRGRA